ncbi:GNAT family N-acetyltransferase [Pasteurella skyensis]|uniref:GNAT family N-acetyltransferase n=1 Tax=Phocoenobacter skyensis TaxID=97481 RepID=A0AAJ6NDN8_9PAST|nr:GNAT family N-acetyltransferase [Pasteurella skyensis]MDP8170765.1 GNAT family N-acetyltransferase [Pasteurella skyensis]MDP8174916.1 GNAT family N-acetyltransferase [Pasteurella skyensis]
MKIFIASEKDIDKVSELFNLYRIFYEQPDNYEASKQFIVDNFKNKRSEIFILEDNGEFIAFVQLYTNYCPIALESYKSLSDLYVKPEYRRKGYAFAIMKHVIDHYKAKGFQRLTLETAIDNIAGQKLYEKLGYQREVDFFTYHKLLK